MGFAREGQTRRARKMEAVDLYGDLEDPFFFKDQSPQPSSQVEMA